jgi:predicted transcriptional regulator
MAEMAAAVYSSVNRLADPTDRAILRMKFLVGHSKTQAQIAECLGLAPATVSRRIVSILAQLRESPELLKVVNDNSIEQVTELLAELRRRDARSKSSMLSWIEKLGLYTLGIRLAEEKCVLLKLIERNRAPIGPREMASSCLLIVDILQYLLNIVDEQERERLERHISTCRKCNAGVEGMRIGLELAFKDNPEPPSR